MRMDDVTPEDVIKAARRIQERKGWFTCKDVWYELEISERRQKYSQKSGDVRHITQLLRSKEIVNSIERVRADGSGHAWYKVKEE